MMAQSMTLTTALLGAVALGLAQQAIGHTVPRSPGLPYGVRNLPDRIVLNPGADPAREMAVTFRTDVAQTTAEAQISVGVDGPTPAERAQLVRGATKRLETSNGSANFHSIRFQGLAPNTVYTYRVKGSAGWSEWLQFRTASAQAAPFRALYVGDVQNYILEHTSRVIRQGFRDGKVELVLHAGDLVSQRDDLDHDDEWGEWSQSGAYHYSTIPQVPAAGNHEYLSEDLPDGTERKWVGPYWGAQFTLPNNGTDPVRSTTYFVDYQGVRFVILDGTAAVDLGALDSQARWLEQTLSTSKARWNVVLMHQPVFTCARPSDTPGLKQSWKPLFQRYRVDLVLQGHDHCYSRLTAEAGKAASERNRAAGGAQGPVYVVSVAGAKMYGIHARARTQPDRVAEATQLYQLIDFEQDRIRFRSYTATGRLYDGFDLNRRPDGSNQLVPTGDPMVPMRTCVSTVGPDGGACVAEPKD